MVNSPCPLIPLGILSVFLNLLSYLLRAKGITEKAGCHYVYVGNTPEVGFENTVCPQCRKVVVERKGYSLLTKELDAGKCKFCNYPINGLWG